MNDRRNGAGTFSRSIAGLLAGAVLLWVGGAVAAGPGEVTLPPAAAAEINAILADKGKRSKNEAKLDSNLLYGMRAVAQANASGSGMTSQGPPAFVQEFLRANVAPDKTIKVTIQATVSDELLAAIRSLGATDISAFPQYRIVYARIPIALLMTLAARPDVTFIRPFDPGTTGRHAPSPAEPDEVRRPGSHGGRQVQNEDAMVGTNAGSVNSQGVIAHKADKAFARGITGTGVKVCVLSDGVDSLAARQASGDLPAVTIVAGQAGKGDEGTAMLEIIHDMAPGARLGFATGFNGSASMATNIVALRDPPHNCDIIVDDVSYFLEAPFQDDIIAQAVSTVTAKGALYFSSAANSGSAAKGTSGTWEGDFVNSKTTIGALAESGTIHSFSGSNANTLTAQGAAKFQVLSWSDPINRSGNDYDLFVLDSTMTSVIAQSTDSQTGTQPAREVISGVTIPAGSKFVVVNYLGEAAPRALRLDTQRGRLSIGTNGNTFGHNAAASAITVAAVNVSTAAGGAFVGGASNPVASYSSDGPRRMFYTPAGHAITPGNVRFSTGGGTLLNKVDIAAADCGSTATAGFYVFCGTSAAAPHAAAIAALIKSANRTLTAAQVRTIMTQSALDIESLGFDANAGIGLVMADTAVRKVLADNMARIVPILGLLD